MPKKSVRKNLVVSESFNRKLEIMTELTGATTEAEAFRKAVELYLKLMKKQLAGSEVKIDGAGLEPLYDMYSVRQHAHETPEMLSEIGLSPNDIVDAPRKLALA